MSSAPPAPEANPHLIGHARVEGVLLKAWAADRLPHAWLLRGPRGVGKATLAYRFARRLLAGSDDEQAAGDPTHPVFRMVAGKAHPDLRVLERVVNPKTGKLYKEILVDQVRLADEALHATAARAGRKVLVVDPADELNPSGANALLKLLEEPPGSTVLLLVCQRPGSLPRTILSRCAQLTLAPLRKDEVLVGLERLAPETPTERAALLGELAEGSLGRALELAGTGWLERYADLVAKLGVARDSETARLTLATQLLQGAEPGGFRGTVDLFGFVLRRLAGMVAGREPATELFPGEARLLRGLAAGRGLEHWVALWDKLSALAERVEAVNLDPVQALLRIVRAVCGADEPDIELSIA
ncbi:MAG TPA: DNA polymerase III subunit delta' [Geminicoccaceae bacterium]|nr:DNA polymerase III subunit delta' [Geminicoccaceae bacterium]